MERNSILIQARQCLVLDLPPSCIEFCPAFPHFFLVGTYNLVKGEETSSTPLSAGEEDGDGSCNANTVGKPQNRNGSVIVFKLEDGRLSQVQTLLQPSALLDLHFCQHTGQKDIAAVASSTGTLTILQMSPMSSPESPLKVVRASQLFPSEVLVLSCAWHPSRPDLIGVTTSTGEVHILNLDQSYNARGNMEAPVIIHSLEAWTINITPMPMSTEHGEAFVIYSGADDSKLCHTKCSIQSDHQDGGKTSIEPIAGTATVKGHGAGVTAILPLPIFLAGGAQVVVTGSYDDTIRVFAMDHTDLAYYPGSRSDRLLAELNLGGGVWRLKNIDIRNENGWKVRILASCMHAGVRLVELEGSEEWSLKTLCRFEEHQSMNYGSDFSPSGDVGDKLCCVSTSFYDKLLCLWEWSTPRE